MRERPLNDRFYSPSPWWEGVGGRGTKSFPATRPFPPSRGREFSRLSAVVPDLCFILIMLIRWPTTFWPHRFKMTWASRSL